MWAFAGSFNASVRASPRRASSRTIFSFLSMLESVNSATSASREHTLSGLRPTSQR